MFGYVTAHKPELKMKEFAKYKAYYCGLCKVLQEKYGFLGQMTLTYDMTFLIVLLTSLYEMKTENEEHRCIRHPLKKQQMLCNEITEYAADMNIVLTYFHFVDDWKDEKSQVGLAGAHAFHKAYKKIEQQYPEKCYVIRKCLALLEKAEKRGEEDIDRVSRYFGELMSELFVFRSDRWEKRLRRMGFYLGKFIYLVDAYDDLEKDLEQGTYNVFLAKREDKDFHTLCEEIITGVMAECTATFELLPCVEDVEIVRNILYAGVWDKFDKKRLEREKKENE